jgi:hypothetical protein
MACDCTFEPVIKVNCVLDLIGLVRTGDLVPNRAAILQHVGCITGSLGKYMEGSTDSVQSLPATSDDLTNCIDDLEFLVLPAITGTTLDQSPSDTVAINPALLALLLKIAELLIKKYLN